MSDRNKILEERLDWLIKEMEYNKSIKNLTNNYHVVLREMINLRDGKEIGS